MVSIRHLLGANNDGVLIANGNQNYSYCEYETHAVEAYWSVQTVL